MYKKLAEQISDPKIGARLREIAKDEGRHAAVFERLTHKRFMPKNTLANAVVVL